MGQPGWIGRSLSGRYQIEAMLGQGGMSAVYRGTDPNLRRTVAIKLIHGHLSEEPAFVSRFEEEAAAVAQLKHPNIIQVYDFDHDGETYFMVLEYIPGETLQARLRKLNQAGKQMAPAEARDLAAGICDALEYAHRRGMIHRDVKPANVMITPEGQPILMDFGIAKIVGGKQHTATGAVVGTAAYISPEQVRGEELDSRVDIYALGVTLFEMLSGRPPFEGDSAMTVMLKHVNEPVPDLVKLNPSVPRDLAQIAMRALAKDRAQRFKSAGEMAAALRAVRLNDDSTGLGMVPTPPGGTVGRAGLPASLSGGGSPPRARAKEAGRRGGGRMAWLAGGGIVVVGLGCVILAGLGLFLYPRLSAGQAVPPVSSSPTATLAETQAPPTVAPSDTAVPPTETPLPTEVPTATNPAGPAARITGIRIENGRYIVDYETIGYVEKLPGMHVHFFFNTVPPTQAGVPGTGPWIVWGGPRPFNGYKVSDRPGGATQMCILAANPNHTVIANSGNCVDLP
jgi:tRNA A-37 threonylcarbamoyl transferase component Bud32